MPGNGPTASAVSINCQASNRPRRLARCWARSTCTYGHGACTYGIKLGARAQASASPRIQWLRQSSGAELWLSAGNKIADTATCACIAPLGDRLVELPVAGNCDRPQRVKLRLATTAC